MHEARPAHARCTALPRLAWGRPALVVALLSSASAVAQEPAPLHREVYAMGTRLQLEVEGLPEAALGEAAEAAVRECERIEAACSTWRADSAWSRLNAAGGAELELGSEWVDLLETVLGWTRRTQGAFDPVLGALLRTWDTRHGGRTPSEDELRAAREASGARLLVLDARRGTARLTHPAAALEEGGFIKGYALDRMAAVLRQAGVRAALLDFGGQLLAFGAPRRAGIAAAAQRHRPAFELELAEGSLSTSGTSEHGRHIVDPRSGARSPAWGSVSVVAADGLTADVLSTALYVLGPEGGLAWAEAHEVAALFQRAGQAPRQTRALRVRTAHLSATGSRP